MEPVKKVRITDTVAEKILAAISNNEFERGQKLPTEREFATTLQVSRNVIREAIRQLESMGVLSVRQGDGTYLNDISSSSLISRAASYLTFDHTTLNDLVEARQALEVKAVSLAAAKASSDDINELYSLLQRMNTLKDSPKEYGDCDLEFHLAIMKASKNATLMRLYRTVQDVLMVQLIRLTEIQGVTEQSYQYHIKIFEAIKNRDSKMAGKLMDEHIANITHRFYRELTKQV